MAAISGVSAAVRIRVKRGDDVNATDEKGRSALHLAASRGHIETCRVLLHAGADPTACDHAGNDALSVALASGWNDVADLVREHCRPVTVAGDLFVVSATAVVLPELFKNLQPVHDLVQPAPETPALLAAAEVPDVFPASQMQFASVIVMLASQEERGAPGDLAFGGWDADPEPVRPAADLGVVVAAGTIQKAISVHKVIDHDLEWDQIAIDLPEYREVRRRRTDPGSEEQELVRNTICAGLRDGTVATSYFLGADALQLSQTGCIPTTCLRQTRPET
jgi:RNA polymerase primary sigma factor